jgi:hypothetical protein
VGEKECGETDRGECERGRELEREDEAEGESDEERTRVRRGGRVGARCRHTRQTAADACDAQRTRARARLRLRLLLMRVEDGSVFDTVERRYGGA